MRIEFWGAARTVTGSMHLLKVSGKQALLDCGLFQGRRQESYDRNLHFPFDPASIDVLVLSHAHIDHSGNIPNLVKQGFKGNIVCTAATRDLCAAMLMDSARIQEQDVAYVNKKNERRGDPLVEPLYTEEDAAAAMHHFITLPYHRTMEVITGVRVTFLDAGHMLGSAIVILDIDEEGKSKRLVFSGDLGRTGTPILRDPERVESADYVIMESTYGNRDHPTEVEARYKLRDIVNQTYRRGGKLLVPAFAVGRTQEIVYALHQLSDAHKVPPLPIYVDSPLAINVTEVYRLHPDCYDEETRRFMASDEHHNPFGFDRLTYVRDTADSKALNFLRDSVMIIAASGMCEGGRILHHLKNNISDPQTTILFVGFQAENTLGRRLMDGFKDVKIFGEPYPVHAQIESIAGFSAHADRKGLHGWLERFDKRRLRGVFLVHGELDAATDLAFNIESNGLPRPAIPVRGQGFDL